ncbi:MAG: hypothetical protein RLN78_05590 [Phycisphaerales bacterium]
MDNPKPKIKPSAFWSPLGVLVSYAAVAEALVLAPLVCSPVPFASVLTPSERSHILWLATGIIFLSLTIFTILILFFTDRLYAPFEYRSDEAFEKISSRWRRRKREQETLEILNAESAESTETKSEQADSKSDSKSTEDDKPASHHIPQIQPQRLKSRSLLDRKKLLNEIIDVERKAIKYLKSVAALAGGTARDPKSLRSRGATSSPDCVIETSNAHTVCEIKYARRARNLNSFVRSGLEQVLSYQLQSNWTDGSIVVKGLILLVHDDAEMHTIDKDEIAATKTFLANSIDTEVEIVVFAKSELAELAEGNIFVLGDSIQTETILKLITSN